MTGTSSFASGPCSSSSSTPPSAWMIERYAFISNRDGEDAPADELDAEQAVQHLAHLERAHARLADDVLDGVLAVDQLEHGELFAREAAAAHLGDRVLVAQEHDVEVVDRALDEVPLVDAAVALHEHGLDVERQGGVDDVRR